jgi:hypothetical protein
VLHALAQRIHDTWTLRLRTLTLRPDAGIAQQECPFDK